MYSNNRFSQKRNLSEVLDIDRLGVAQVTTIIKNFVHSQTGKHFSKADVAMSNKSNSYEEPSDLSHITQINLDDFIKQWVVETAQIKDLDVDQARQLETDIKYLLANKYIKKKDCLLTNRCISHIAGIKIKHGVFTLNGRTTREIVTSGTGEPVSLPRGRRTSQFSKGTRAGKAGGPPPTTKRVETQRTALSYSSTSSTSSSAGQIGSLSSSLASVQTGSTSGPLPPGPLRLMRRTFSIETPTVKISTLWTKSIRKL